MIYKVSAIYDNVHSTLFYFEYEKSPDNNVIKHLEDIVDAMGYGKGYGLDIQPINFIDIYSSQVLKLIDANKLHIKHKKELSQFQKELSQLQMEVDSMRKNIHNK